MQDLFQKLAQKKGPLGQFSHFAHENYMFPKLEGDLGTKMTFKGQKIINWSINNYLGLANHPEVRQADAESAARWGLAYPMGSRMMSGNTDLHDRLEADLSSFLQKEATVLFNFGYQGIMSAIDALLTRNDIVIYDAEAHACIIDGVRLHLGKRLVYGHNDLVSLEKQLIRATEMLEDTDGCILVITEGVFGMGGDQGKLKEIAALKRAYSFRLLVDDAHGFGTMGDTGMGTGEAQGVQHEIDIYFGTFAKSMASIGGFICGPKTVIDFLRYNVRSQIFAKSLPMPIVEGNIKRLELLRRCPELKQKLWDNVIQLQHGLRERGFNLGATNSPVTPVYLSGSVNEAIMLITELRDKYSIFCSAVIYPVIPKGQLLLRLIPTADHTPDQILHTLQAFSAVAEKLHSREYDKVKITEAVA